jgi:glycosyltransferase involved in cell wall biosynthesis
VLESFNCGCPLITSNVSSLPEVAADAAMYFNPADELSIRQAVNKVLNNENLRKTLINKGFERAKDFSWEKTAKKTLSLYEAL